MQAGIIEWRQYDVEVKMTANRTGILTSTLSVKRGNELC